MAGVGNKLARIDVLIGGADQARKQVEEMRKEWARLGKEIQAAQKQMEATVDTVDYDKNKAAYTEAVKQQKQLQKSIQETERNINTVEKYLADVSGQTLRNLNNARTGLNQMLLGVNPKNFETLQTLRDYIKQIGDEIQRRKGNLVEFSDIMGNIGNVSDKSLGMAKQRLQELVASTEKNSAELQNFRDQLSKIEEEERRRISQRAQSTLGSIQGGTFNATIGETKEAIKLLEQYKQQLKISDTQGIQQVDDAIKSLNERIKQASDSTMSLQDSLDLAEKVGKGTFDGTIEDLDRLKKTLEDYKKKLKATDTQGLKQIQDALQNIEKQQKKVARETVNIDDTLKNLRTAPLEDLQKAAARLQSELSEAERNTEEYVKASRKLRSVNAQIKEVKRSWEEHDNQIVATMKRLTSYVLVYAGFNEVVGRMKQLLQANLELSDSMADIQKTTGLTAEAVADLGTEIDKMDTRTAQQQLYELAASAGQAGLSSREDILGFVRAADQLTIALNELGNDGVNTLLKISNLTGEGKMLGTEKALLAIGSSINELSAASVATAGPITEIISRIGSIASVSKLSMADMAALGATLDELGQEAEVSGTALTTFITALQTNTRSIAMATGLDDKELERMMKAGKTMEAIVMVLEKLGSMGKEEGMKALAPILKEFGSDGERLNRVLSSLSQNTDILRARVDLSREAYEEATSVTEEAMVKQESAIGILNRLGNELKETFVNSGVVDGIKNILLVLDDFLQWLKVSPQFVMAFTSALAGLTAAYIANTIAVKANLKELTISEAWVKTRAAVIAFGKALLTAKTYTELLTKSWKSFGKVLSANWISLLAGALIAAGTAIYQFATRVSEAAKASADHAVALEKETMRVDALFEGVKNLNTPLKDRKKLIAEINAQYGDYLGFLISDTDSTEKLAAAQERVNAKIKERMALQLKEKMEERAAEQYGGEMQDALTSITGGFERAKGISDARASEARRLVQNIVDKNITLPINDILSAVKQELSKAFDTETGTYGSAAYFDIKSSLKDYINAQKDYRKALDVTLDEVNKEVKESDDELIKANNNLLNAITADWNELQKIKTDSLDEKQLDEHNMKLKKVAEEYIKIASEQLQIVSGDQQKQLQEYVGFYENAISQIEKISKQKEPNIWGYGKTIDDASVDQLVVKYKQLFDERTTMRADADYTTAYAKEFKNRSEAMDWYLQKLKEIEAQLNKMGYDTGGNFLKGKKRGRGEEKEMRDEMTAALSALETYFVSRQVLIKESRSKEEITEQEMFRQLENTEFEHLNARIKLRRSFLGDMDALSKEELKTYGLDGKDLEKLSKSLMSKGQAMRDGVLLKLVEDELKMREDLLKHQQAIRKILLDNDYTGQVDKEFMDAIDKLELLFGKQEEMTEEAGNRRMVILRSLASESYLIDTEEFKKRIEAQSEFSQWRIGKTEEDYQALLLMLQKYNDDYEAAENRSIERRKKIAEKKWEKSGQEQDWQNRTDTAQADVTFMENAKSLGIASDSMVEDAKLNLYKLRIAASQAYLEQMQKEMQAEVDKAYQEKLLADELYNITKGTDYEDPDAKQKALEADAAYEAAKRAQMQMTLEARQQLNEAMMELDEQEMEIQRRKMESLKGYTDAIVDFSEQMGEAAFGEVEDRQEAAKLLVKTAMKLTKDLIMQKVQELVMKKALGAQEVAQEASTSGMVTAIHGTQAVTDLTVQGAKTTADIAAGTASGAAKTIGQLGWWGIPLIAVISAALSALMGLAMGKLNKAKEEVASATGVSSSKGRVAAGMLTYAKGDYPVLGNDGQIYNARYQKELKTGVYGGGAHFGIFSEKKPEMIVDGDTTQKLILNYPHIYDSILTIARHGQLKQAAMPTFATGNYPSAASGTGMQGQAFMPDVMSNTQMQETLVQLSAAVSSLTDRLNKPISATMDPYQANKTLKKTDKFMNKRGLIP